MTWLDTIQTIEVVIFIITLIGLFISIFLNIWTDFQVFGMYGMKIIATFTFLLLFDILFIIITPDKVKS